jgi:uncharacterized protein YcfJ
MNVTQNSRRIHPLVATAAISVTLVSALGIAAITGVLPKSFGYPSETSREVSTENMPTAKDAQRANGAEGANSKHTSSAHATTKPGQVNREDSQNQATTAQAQPAQKAAEKNSAVGIGVGALIGGVLGNQIGSGDGKTLATIAGAVGGGYIGNEVAKKNQK